MIKLKVQGTGNKFYDVLIDDDFKVSSKDKISKRITENLIEYTNLETTGAKGTLEHQFLNYLKQSKYNDVVKIVDFKATYYPYDYEVNEVKYSNDKELKNKKGSIFEKVKKLFKK